MQTKVVVDQDLCRVPLCPGRRGAPDVPFCAAHWSQLGGWDRRRVRLDSPLGIRDALACLQREEGARPS